MPLNRRAMWRAITSRLGTSMRRPSGDNISKLRLSARGTEG